MAAESIIVFFSIIGLFDSLYALWRRKFQNSFLYCFTTKLEKVNCKDIQNSAYAKLFAIFNSWPGAFGYTLLGAIYFYAAFCGTIATRLYEIGFLISGLGAVLSYYLLYIQIFKFKKYCLICLISTLIITIITLTALKLIY